MLQLTKKYNVLMLAKGHNIFIEFWILFAYVLHKKKKRWV